MITLQEITPRRYVFHVTYRLNRDSIVSTGLKANTALGNKAVFAHNSSVPQLFWYPILLDELEGMISNNYNVKFESNYDYFKMKCIQYGYDFWQIDTYKLSGKWYRDNLGMSDFMPDCNYPFFIFYKGDIPCKAIKLYNFFEYPKVRIERGVSHIMSDFRGVA